ncbi:CRISPR-associated Cse4 family protein [Rhodovulum steppense]|uniref:CRISPR-associated Cse4 family protein n=2 Tax=Rhodovulum steppense TaxID=540251 RepID=A0A4R1YZR6_9RHOB|nr:CRISPR-associated Cse4 family protein [Rhodovulum steppense]
MPDPRFLQIHFLAPYTAALLNRDDAGLAKRLPYGGHLRTRVSSQCLKYHWRWADDLHALSEIAGWAKSYRSRSIVDSLIVEECRDGFSDEVVSALAQWFNFAVYSGKGDEKPKKRGVAAKADEKEGRPTLLFGEPEIRWLKSEFVRLAKEADGEPDTAFSLGESWVGLPKKGRSEFQKNREANLEALRQAGEVPAGLTGALFGRMVTSDPKANIEAPVHVAHAFTVHAEEAESDYFIAADDLARGEDTGADTIQETELTSGLFYGYVVVDIPGLLSNLGGDARLAGEALHNLVYLIAEVSPGAKLGSTAPYSRASFLMLEAGDRQPRSLAEAFRSPCSAETGQAVAALSEHLAALDAAYATGESRHVMSLANAEVPGAERGTLADLAGFAQGLPARIADRAA